MLNESLQSHWQLTHKQFEQFRQRWLVGDGGNSLPALNLLSTDELARDEKNLTALALFSQAHLFVAEPSPPDLKPMVQLPALDLQLIPNRYRGSFRRLLSEFKQHPLAMYAILSQMAAHGYAPNPLDWLPKDKDSFLPVQLLPWLYFHWGHPITPELNVATWPTFSALQQTVLIKQMREKSPELARAILQACLPAESAEIRAAHLSFLQIGLSLEDLPLIQQFANERAFYVKTICWHLQLQLGLAIERQAPTTELIEWLQQERHGLLLQRKRIVAREIKNSVQAQNLLKALGFVDLIALADTFSLSIDEFFEQWSFVDQQSMFSQSVNQTLLQSAALQLTPLSVRRLLARLAKDVLTELPIKKLMLQTLLNRLTRSERSEYVQLVMTRCPADTPITDLADLNMDIFTWLTSEEFNQCLFKQQLTNALTEYTKAKEDTAVQRKLSQLLHWLGLLLPVCSAKLVWQSAIDAGIDRNDAMLDTLSFHLSLQQGPHNE